MYKVIHIYTDNKARLDDDQIINVKDLQIFPEGSKSINDSVKNIIQKKQEQNENLKSWDMIKRIFNQIFTPHSIFWYSEISFIFTIILLI